MSDSNDADDDSDNSELWWGYPVRANRYHVFDGKKRLAGSLCGNWMLTYQEQDSDVKPDSDTFKEGSDCKACARKAGVLNE